MIHAMSQVLEEEGTDGILLIDASNAKFNNQNEEVSCFAQYRDHVQRNGTLCNKHR